MAISPRRKSDAARRANQLVRSRTLLMMAILGVATFIALFIKLYSLQVVRHEDLESQAVKQQTLSTVVTASRGTIYDRNSHVLAVSATAETVFISPLEIIEFEETQAEKIKDGKLDAAKERDRNYIAKGLSRILDISEESILKHMENTTSQYEVLASQVEQDVADEVRRFLNGQIDTEGNEYTEINSKGETVAVKNPVKLRGIYLAADSKRYYPYDSLASHIIGFVNSDNQGAYGLEAVYEEELEGTAGYTVTAKNAANKPLLYQYEQYFDAENGDSLVLTIDTNVQYYLEKGLESMVAKFDAKNGAAGIIMNVNTGAIVAMASLPNYDLNNAWSVTDSKLLETLDGLEEGSDAYNQALGAAQLRQWRSKCFNDTYEPGSTFKPITLSVALEEGLVNMNTTFNCTGSIMVPGWYKAINCSKHSGHGLQTLKVATGNSCNPAFITMGLRIGTSKYYDYLESFGLMESTGIGMNGEATSIFASRENFCSGVVSLASYAFGQTFNVTPLQLIRAQAACINGGYLYTPYLVEQVLDQNGNIVTQHDATPVRQVISEETSSKVRECLEYVVAQGTGKNGQVTGYRIGGKTGTADKTGNKNRDIVVSFMCFAPADDPEYIMLLTLDTPSRTTGTYPSGGNMVAPTASQIMAEVLPYLGVEPDYSDQQLASADATVPNVVGKTLEEAKTRLDAAGFAYKTVGDGATVTDQTPVGGSIVPNDAKIILYMGAEKSTKLCTVPNVVGMSATQANQALTNAGLIMKVTGAVSSESGNVHAIRQSEEAGKELEAGSVVTVQFGSQSSGAD